MTRKTRSPWYLYAALGLIVVGVVALAVTAIGPSSRSTRTSTEVVTAARGVVQSTVSGSGNIAAGADDTINFGTSGTLQHVYVKVGDHVEKGQLLATLDPSAAQLTLDQADESLNAAQLQLTAAEEGASTGGSGSNATNASTQTEASPEFVTYRPQNGSQAPTGSQTPAKSNNPQKSKSKSPQTTTTTPTTTPTTTTTPASAPSTRSSGGGSGGSGSGSGSGEAGQTTSTTNAASAAASQAQAQASVYSAEAAVRNAETALNETKLYAPISGTVVSLASISPGQTVSGSGNSSSASSSANSDTSGSGSTGAVSSGSLGGSTSSSSSSSSSSTGFAEIVNTHKLTMTVAFSESDISKLKVGQSANISLDALSGVQLAGRVSAISDVATTSSSVVSYDVTLTLDQNDSEVKPGMSASASVIVKQARGVTVPNAAITGAGSLGTVEVRSNGKTEQQQVVTGLQGDSRTVVISGLKAGQQLVVRTTLPSLGASSTSGSSSSSTGTLGGAGGFGGAGGLGGAGGFGGAGRFFRGAGGP